MGCNSCSSGKDGQPKGCKNNGTCGTDGCNKLTVFDWLANMSLPGGATPFNCIEVRFKNGRKHFFKNTNNLSLSIGDIVATEAVTGHDVGIVTLTGELVRIQMKRKKIAVDSEEVRKVFRKASQKDIDIWQKARDREKKIQIRSREIAIRLQLQMKISDIEFQGDGSKCTFYYTAEERVDFRQLIKEFAQEFNTKIEMRQIGFRQEAARLGGIGSCGRELCCSTWLTDFRSVNTSAARYQQLSLNPQKLAGQCGKLKCCLNYELDTYIEALQKFPKTDIKLQTEKGTAVFQKIDIFQGCLWYAYEGEWMNWHKLSADQATEIVTRNEEGQKVVSLEEYSLELLSEDTKTDYEDVVGQDSLTRFDKPRHRKRRKNKKPKSGAQARTGDKGGRNRNNKEANQPKTDKKPKKSRNGKSKNPNQQRAKRRPQSNTKDGQKK